jgi:hypothetical protein
VTESEPAWRSLLKDGELVAEGQNLRFKFGPRSDAGPNGCKESRDAGAHTDAPYQQRAPSSITTGSTEFLVRTANHRKRLGSKAPVVSVAEKVPREASGENQRRRTPVNCRSIVESTQTTSKPGVEVNRAVCTDILHFPARVLVIQTPRAYGTSSAAPVIWLYGSMAI